MTSPLVSAPSLRSLTILGCFAALVATTAGVAWAQDSLLETSIAGGDNSDPNNTGESRTVNSTTAASLSDSSAGAFYSLTTQTAYGSGTTTTFGSVPATEPYHGSWASNANASARWRDLFTLGGTTAFRARVTMHFSGDAQADAGAGTLSAVGVTIGTQDGIVVNTSQSANNPDYVIPASVVFDVGISYNGPSPAFLLDCTVAAFTSCPAINATGGGFPANHGSAQASLRFGGFVLLDADDQVTDYVCESLTGSARALTYPAGGSYSGFSLTNATPDRLGSTVQLLGGQASAPTQVVTTFVAPPTDNVIKPVSDVVDLSGTNTDPVVIQVSFDPTVAQNKFGIGYAAYLSLAWFKNSTGTWKNAVLGNTGTTMPTFFNRAYNPATDFHLGYCGLDTANHVAWAVVNHNSEYVVTFPPPVLAVRSVTRPSAGLVHLNCTGEPARANRVEVSTNLQSWSTLATVTAGGDGTFQYDDSAAAGPQRFYRVAYP